MSGLKKDFIPMTPILSSEVNNNFDVITNWEVKNEDLTSQIDGTQTIFTTLYPYVANSLIVIIDGIRQRKNTHYTETGSNTFTMTAGNAPQTNQDICVDYRRGDL